MKTKLLTTAFLLFAVTVFTSVYCEAATVPAATTIIEKAILPTPVEFVACPNGAIISPIFFHSDFITGYNVQILSLHKIHWVVDETFYATGYKALLNKEVTEILAPPKEEDWVFVSIHSNDILNSKKGKGATGRNPRDGLS